MGGGRVSGTPWLPLPQEKTWYPFYRRLGGPQGQSGRAQNLTPHRDSIPDIVVYYIIVKCGMLVWRSYNRCFSSLCLVAFDAAICHKDTCRCLIGYNILLTAVGFPPSGSARDMATMRRFEVMSEECNERRICAWLQGWSQTYKQNNNNYINILVEPQTNAIGQYAV